MFAQITEIKYKHNLSIKKSIPLGDAVNLNTDANFTEWHHTSNIAKQLYCDILRRSYQPIKLSKSPSTTCVTLVDWTSCTFD